MSRTPVSANVRFYVLQRDEFRCQACGARSPDAVLQVDHIVPASKGGTNEVENLQCLCISCNFGKRDHLVDKPIPKPKMQKEKSGKQGLIASVYQSVCEWWQECLEQGACLPGLCDWSETVSILDIHDAWWQFAVTHGHEYNFRPQEFGVAFRRITPTLRTIRLKNSDGRPRVYVLPSIDSCRRHFSAITGREVASDLHIDNNGCGVDGLIFSSRAEEWWYAKLKAGKNSSNDESWRQEVSKHKLVDDFISTMGMHEYPRRSAEAMVGIAIARLVPRMHSMKKTINGKYGIRVPHYRLPDISEARLSFEKAYGRKIEWPVNEGETKKLRIRRILAELDRQAEENEDDERFNAMRAFFAEKATLGRMAATHSNAPPAAAGLEEHCHDGKFEHFSIALDLVKRIGVKRHSEEPSS